MAQARTRRPDDRPDEILAAARAVFSEKGLEAARMDAIARRAGVSKGTLYHYFASKEALFEALIERSAGDVAARAEALVAAAGDADPEATLRAILRHVCAAMADPAVFAAPRLVLAEANRFPRLAAFYRDHVIHVGKRALTRLLAAGAASGAFRAVDPEIALRAIMGPVLASAFLKHVFEDAAAPEPGELADGLTDLLLRGLKPGPGEDRA